jgi:hypothetical protein
MEEILELNYQKPKIQKGKGNYCICCREKQCISGSWYCSECLKLLRDSFRKDS